MKHESHHMALLERFAPDAPAPESDDPVVRMAHRLSTKKGRALYGLRAWISAGFHFFLRDAA